MEKVRLLNVTSFSSMVVSGWREFYKIHVEISGKIYEIRTDLKNGVKKEVQKYFSPQKYSYNCFEAKYGRAPKSDFDE